MDIISGKYFCMFVWKTENNWWFYVQKNRTLTWSRNLVISDLILGDTVELNRDKILSKFYKGEELTKTEINWLAEQEFDQFSQGIEPVPFEEKMYKALAKDVK